MKKVFICVLIVVICVFVFIGCAQNVDLKEYSVDTWFNDETGYMIYIHFDAKNDIAVTILLENMKDIQREVFIVYFHKAHFANTKIVSVDTNFEEVLKLYFVEDYCEIAIDLTDETKKTFIVTIETEEGTQSYKFDVKKYSKTAMKEKDKIIAVA